MMTAHNQPIAQRVRAVLSTRTQQVVDAHREIARLTERVRNLQIENQLLSDRLAEIEK